MTTYQMPSPGDPHYFQRARKIERMGFVDLLRDPLASREQIISKGHRSGFIDISFEKAIRDASIDPYYRLYIDIVGPNVEELIIKSAVDSLIQYASENRSATYAKFSGALYETFKRELEKHYTHLPQEAKNELSAAISTLTPREAGVLQYRYGLLGPPPKTLEEVGYVFGVGGERIRQIQTKALRRLRHPSRRRRIEPLLEV